MPLSSEDRATLKKPFGILVPDGEITKQKVASLLKDATKVITVGDATTERLVGFGFIPDLAVVDGKERRSARKISLTNPAKEMHCKNPAGLISQDAICLLGRALEEKTHVRIFVEGEEDMLALPLFAMAPLGAVVLYGQPLEGLVAVEITPAKRKQAKDLMDRIGVRS